MILKIRQVGEQVLRQKARVLSTDEILDRSTQELIESMRETMHDAPGVGLAAPQVGFPLQLVVIEDQLEFIQKLPAEQVAERERRPVPFHVLINPKLTLLDAEPAKFFEGCLSLAGFTAVVPRARQVRVDCLNERAEPVTIEAAGWYARILQHEIDHLGGVLYVDRMNSHTFFTQDNYVRHWKDRAITEVTGYDEWVEEHEVYSVVGAEGFERLVAGFYRQVPGDDVLGPMYPADDLPGAKQRLRDFLIYRFGGPPLYIEQRGHPRLRMRHAPFPIGQGARDRWIQLMNCALDESKFPDEVKQLLREFFAAMATFMINRPGY